MTDYGHDLSFGTFLTPQNQRPQDVVDLARLSEEVGLDLVTFQDHPYQPGFLDTWTLLSWVAARTSRIHVAPNVTNLPLRAPAVLARAAASLDLLSGGRLELGLGAGGFADAVAAMGGPRRTAGEARKALDKAIDVIRSIWDTTERGGVRVDGEHYQVHGAKRGPEPAHDIAIWVGAYGPRMLQLVGRKADGWLPTLAYLKDGDLERGNRIIDAAATAAGRDPRAIRRLLNIGGDFGGADDGFLQGPPEQWVEQLLRLVLEQGVSSFMLASDDPRMIAIFGEEVAPALREEVARERGARGTAAGAVIRDPKALALRHDDLDYGAVPPSLARTAVEPGDRGYAKVRSNFWYAGSPGLVLRPEMPEQVAEALEYARKQDVPLAIRSGGHAVTGNGRLVRTDATHHPDLFWAVRGAGGNVGIVTAEVDEVIHSQMVFDGTDLAHLLQNWADVVENAPRELNSFLYASPQRGGTPVVHLTSVYAGPDGGRRRDAHAVARRRSAARPAGRPGAVRRDPALRRRGGGPLRRPGAPAGRQRPGRAHVARIERADRRGAAHRRQPLALGPRGRRRGQ